MSSIFVFDAYGTLLDVHAAIGRYRSEAGPEADRLSEIWRTKQLEYSWTLTLAGRYVEFWTLTQRALDYAWHMALPLIAMSISAFATLTMLTKNSFIDEIRKQYVLTARMKGLSQRRVLYGHVFRNAMLIVISGFPAAFVGVLFTNSLLIEKTFSLNGLGLLNYEAILNRDYPIVLASIFILSLVGLVVNLISDLIYMLVDPRIDFESREV